MNKVIYIRLYYGFNGSSNSTISLEYIPKFDHSSSCVFCVGYEDLKAQNDLHEILYAIFNISLIGANKVINKLDHRSALESRLFCAF